MIAIIAAALLAMPVKPPPQDTFTPLLPAMTAQNSGSFEQHAQDAKRALVENRDDDAIEGYRQALRLKPDWGEGLWHLGTLLYKKEKPFEACTVLRHFLAQDPRNGYGWALLGLAEFESHDYTRALDHLQLSARLGLGDNQKIIARVRYVVAILLNRSEQSDESMILLFTLLTDGGDTSSLIEPFGLAALRLPLLPSEIPASRREMIRVAGAATLALEERNYAKAERILKELETRYPEQPGIHFLMGAYLLNANPEDGIRELKREIEISPAHLPARIRLAQEYIKQRSLDLGISLARETMKLAPEDPRVHMVLGEGLIAQGDSTGGIRELETARASLPDEVQVRWDLFRAYTAAGRKEDASQMKNEIEELSKQENSTH